MGKNHYHSNSDSKHRETSRKHRERSPDREITERSTKSPKKSPTEYQQKAHKNPPTISQINPESPAECLAEIVKNPPRTGLIGALDNAYKLYESEFTSEIVEEVLKLSYGKGKEALKFFKWAETKLSGKHTQVAWNQIVDVLGKSGNYDEMWECIKSMSIDRSISNETFVSVFTSYAQAKKSTEALMAFEVTGQYGFLPNVVLLNSLISALCRYSQTKSAAEILGKLGEKWRIRPSLDSYAIILEGCEREKNLELAWKFFDEMVIQFGWNPGNTAIYTVFLKTLVSCDQMREAFRMLTILQGKRCFPEAGFFDNALQVMEARKDVGALALWDFMKQNGMSSSTQSYNCVISLLCSEKRFNDAYALLDEMVFRGAFPNSKTYNCFLENLIAADRVEEATGMFKEMSRNRVLADYGNCVSAVKMYVNAGNPDMAVTMWKHMMTVLERMYGKGGVPPSSECVHVLVRGLCDLGRVSEARKYCQQAIDKGAQVTEGTLAKLKSYHRKSLSHSTRK